MLQEQAVALPAWPIRGQTSARGRVSPASLQLTPLPGAVGYCPLRSPSFSARLQAHLLLETFWSTTANFSSSLTSPARVTSNARRNQAIHSSEHRLATNSSIPPCWEIANRQGDQLLPLTRQHPRPTRHRNSHQALKCRAVSRSARQTGD